MPKSKSKSQKRRNNSKTSPNIDIVSRAQKKVKTLGSEVESWFSAEDDSDFNSTVLEMKSSQTPSTSSPHGDTHGETRHIDQSATFTYCLAEDDVIRIALKTKELMKDEIESLVDLKVKAATASYTSDIQKLLKDNQQLKEEMASLRATVDDLEQYSRRNCLRISGVPEADGENTDTIVLNTANKLNVNISPADIDRSHRIGRPAPGKPREIIVKFSGYHARRGFMLNRKELKGSNIYINEDLTKGRKSMAYMCRQLVKDKRLHQTWTYDGNIFVKDKSDVKHRIYTVSDLDKFK